MREVKIYDLVGKKVLVTRSSARTLSDAFAEWAQSGNDRPAFNLEHVMGITPSFFDEMLRMVEETGESFRRITISNPPTELSSKFRAVAKAHGLSISESESGSWLVGRNRMMGDSDPRLPIQA